ncbi:ribonuclease P protein subunit p25-like protein isoform X1 [Fukomys damarensis]|uniref:ribonuclease P protein subunit p25-like protein isoform X1 n=1 Tax=Fukomys damarensis TaxID=885580 RepID=UPI000540293D|nr:ribonuclease P protein subunit p25-like protein isoform X1 [Fukomys damarensis]
MRSGAPVTWQGLRETAEAGQEWLTQPRVRTSALVSEEPGLMQIDPVGSNLELTASKMEHYRKAGSVEIPAPSPMPQLPPDTLEMRVRDGSKIRNLLGLALGRLEGGSARHVVFSGSGRAAGKAVSCAEIVKRRVPGLHQLTKLHFLQTEDSWVPTSPDTGLDPLTVRRHVPAVWVLLSRDPLDPSECGYQPPGAPPGLGSVPSSSCGSRSRRRPRDNRS